MAQERMFTVVVGQKIHLKRRKRLGERENILYFMQKVADIRTE